MEHREAQTLPAELRPEHVLPGASDACVHRDGLGASQERQRGKGLTVHGGGEPDGEEAAGEGAGGTRRASAGEPCALTCLLETEEWNQPLIQCQRKR